jgi:hypothetical protein
MKIKLKDIEGLLPEKKHIPNWLNINSNGYKSLNSYTAIDLISTKGKCHAYSKV